MRFPSKLLLLALMCGTFYIQTVLAQQDNTLSLKEITTALRSTSGDFTSEERISYIIDSVKVRGVDFLLSSENENQLKEAGATPELLNIIREESEREATSEENIKRSNELYSQGLDLYNKQNFQQAIENFQQAIELNPRHAFAYGGLGVAYFDKKEFEKSIEFFNKAIAVKPNPNLYYNRAAAYFSLREFGKAIRDYSQVIESRPTYFQAYLSRGSAYFSNDQYEKAVEDYEKVLELNPDNKDAPKKLSLTKKWIEVLDKRKQKQNESPE